MTETYIIGDLHGYYEHYVTLLQNAGLIDGEGNWTGGTNHFWSIGDLFDRGTRGIDCLNLTMQLQRQAREAGGDVDMILGNHEMMMLCAWRFGDRLTRSGMKVIDQWLTWGGIETDLEQFTEDHANWLSDLPLMHKIGDALLVHADAMFYINHGRTVEQVNKSFKELLRSDDLRRWEVTLSAFAEHRAFSSLALTGTQRADQMLRFYGARRLIHGHTPIPFATSKPAAEVTGPYEYAGGRCVNVDGGIYMGSPGFIYQLPSPGFRG